jgi:hypothetical protein
MASARSLQLSLPDPKEKSATAEARRILVLRNMCELMREMGRSDEFSDPDEWLKSTVARPRS